MMDNIDNKNNKNVNKKEWAKCSLYIVNLWGEMEEGGNNCGLI
jgi:hypothetical protein